MPLFVTSFNAFTFGNYIMSILILKSLKIAPRIIIFVVYLNLENLPAIFIKTPGNWVGDVLQNTHSNACKSVILGSGREFINEIFHYLHKMSSVFTYKVNCSSFKPFSPHNKN